MLTMLVACGDDNPAPTKAKPIKAAKQGADRPPEAPPPPLAAEPVDLSEILGRPRDHVREYLGATAPDDGNEENQDSFGRGAVSMTVTYGTGGARILLLVAEGASLNQLAAWLKMPPINPKNLAGRTLEVNGMRFRAVMDESRGTAIVWIGSQEMPDAEVDLPKVIGASRKALRKRYGKPDPALDDTDMFNLPDGASLSATYGDGGRCESAAVSFAQGVHAVSQRAEVLEWLRLPNAAKVEIGGTSYKIRVDSVGVRLAP